MGDLAQGMDTGIGPASAAEVDETQTRVMDDVLDASGHGAHTVPGLAGTLLLPPLEPASVIFDQQPERGQGRWFHGHGQEPMRALTASIKVAGSWIGLAM